MFAFWRRSVFHFELFHCITSKVFHIHPRIQDEGFPHIPVYGKSFHNHLETSPFTGWRLESASPFTGNFSTLHFPNIPVYGKNLEFVCCSSVLNIPVYGKSALRMWKTFKHPRLQDEFSGDFLVSFGVEKGIFLKICE